MEKNCIVCNSILTKLPGRCSKCGFLNENKMFVNKEQYQEWIKRVVEPYRNNWIKLENKRKADKTVHQVEARIATATNNKKDGMVNSLRNAGRNRTSSSASDGKTQKTSAVISDPKAEREIVLSICMDILKAKSVFLIKYEGINVEDDLNLRKEMKNNDIQYKVYKNSLLKEVFKALNRPEMYEYLLGPIALVISKDDELRPIRIFAKYKKKCKTLRMLVGIIRGRFFDENELKKLENIPSRESLIKRLEVALVHRMVQNIRYNELTV